MEMNNLCLLGRTEFERLAYFVLTVAAHIHARGITSDEFVAEIRADKDKNKSK